MLQEFFVRPRHHRVVLAALLGHIPARPDAIDLEGGVMAGRAHPWLEQMVQDLEALGDLDEGYELLERYRLPDGRLNIIQLIQEGAQDLEQIDVHQLKQKYLAVALPPPGFETHMATSMTQVATDTNDDVMLYECTLRAADGDICRAKFKHEHGLRAHQRMALGGEHGFRCYLNQMIITNCCPICYSAFKRRSTAVQHTRNSIARGYCVADISITADIIKQPPSYACPDHECNYYTDNLRTLQSHIVRSHLGLKPEHELILEDTVFPLLSERLYLAAHAILNDNSSSSDDNVDVVAEEVR